MGSAKPVETAGAGSGPRSPAASHAMLGRKGACYGTGVFVAERGQRCSPSAAVPRNVASRRAQHRDSEKRRIRDQERGEWGMGIGDVASPHVNSSTQPN